MNKLKLLLTLWLAFSANISFASEKMMGYVVVDAFDEIGLYFEGANVSLTKTGNKLVEADADTLRKIGYDGGRIEGLKIAS